MQIHSVRLTQVIGTMKTVPVKKLAAATRAQGTNALDAASPLFAPFAARWDAEATRRAELRTPENLKSLMKAQSAHTSARATAAAAKNQRSAAKKQTKNPWSGARRGAKVADRAARMHHKQARADLKTARRNYPVTLRRLVAQVHAAHAAAAGLTSYVLTEQAHALTVWPGVASAGVIAAQVGALALGRRQVVAQVDGEGLSGEEQRLMGRLDPSWWVQHAHERDLTGTLTEHPEMTPAGIVVGVRLDGAKWTASKLAGCEEQVRALLGMLTETRMHIGRGTHGDRALMVIRTRSASDGMSMLWTPDHAGIGVDEVTGEIVDVPNQGTHKLIAGVTNMGKSVSWRPWMMQAVMDPLWAGVLLDPKRLEARQWQGKIRTEGHQRGSNEEVRQAIYDAVRELVAEMQHRQEIADVTQWVPTREHPNLLVVIEEGRQILQMAKDKRWGNILDLIDDLYTLARATGIWIIWATQYPSRTNGGVTAMVAENSLTVMSLTVDSPVSDRVVYGENAADAGWEPSKLGSIPGRALVKHKNRTPNPVRIWHVVESVIEGLPDIEVWRHRATKAAAPAATKLKLVKSPEVPSPREEEAAPVPAGLNKSDLAVLDAVRAAGRPVAQGSLLEVTGLSKGTVSKAARRLTDGGHLVRGADGSLSLPASAEGEVSA
ncbi:MarR family transcriptional regulator [Streptomyces sp. NPDC001054]